MYLRITFSEFCDAIRRHGCEDQFSNEALEALFDYFEQYEEDTGEKIELDIPTICCNYAESTVDEFLYYYGLDVSGCEDNSDKCDLVEEFLNDNTTIVWSKGDTFLYQQF